MREDDSCAPHSPHTMSIQQVRPFGLGGFGVSSFSHFDEWSFPSLHERCGVLPKTQEHGETPASHFCVQGSPSEDTRNRLTQCERSCCQSTASTGA